MSFKKDLWKVSDVRKLCRTEGEVDKVLFDFDNSLERISQKKFLDSPIGTPGLTSSDEVILSISKHTGLSYEKVLADTIKTKLIMKDFGRF